MMRKRMLSLFVTTLVVLWFIIPHSCYADVSVQLPTIDDIEKKSYVFFEEIEYIVTSWEMDGYYSSNLEEEESLGFVGDEQPKKLVQKIDALKMALLTVLIFFDELPSQISEKLIPSVSYSESGDNRMWQVHFYPVKANKGYFVAIDSLLGEVIDAEEFLVVDDQEALH